MTFCCGADRSRSWSFLTPSQRDFLQQLAPLPETERSGTASVSPKSVASRCQPSSATSREGAVFCYHHLLLVFASGLKLRYRSPKPKLGTASYGSPTRQPLPMMMPLPWFPASLGTFLQERERLAAYLALSPEKKAALCGWDSSNTAITRLVGFVPLSAASPEPPSSWRKRLRDVEEGLAALRGRVDVVEERTGTVIGEASRDCHAFRLRPFGGLLWASLPRVPRGLFWGKALDP